MKRYVLIVIMFMFAAPTLAADEKDGVFEINNDLFLTGAIAVQDKTDVDDLFMFGETVRIEKGIVGSAHLFGRKVISMGAIGADVYAAGMDIALSGKTAGDVTVSGYNVQVGEVGGDLRVSGANITLTGPVSGYALIAGDEVEIKSIIKGDVHLNAREVDFAEGARVEGTLTIYEEQAGDIEIPAQVVPEDRIKRLNISEWSEANADIEIWNWQKSLEQLLTWVLIIMGIAILIAAIIPQKLANLRRSILDRPFRSLLFGFLALSVAIGSTITLMLTGIGLLLAPATLVLAIATAFAGYVVGAYALGVGLLLLIKQPEPRNIGTRALAAGIGALVVALVGLIPFLGWLFVMATALVGLGAVTIWLFQPKFFATA